MEGGLFPALCAAALTAAVSLLLLREFGFRGAPVAAALCGILLLLGYAGRFSEPVSELLSLTGRSGVREAAGAVLKVIGVGALASLTASVCEEIGEKSVSRAVTLAAKAEIFLIVFPYLSEAVGVGLSLFEEGLSG